MAVLRNEKGQEAEEKGLAAEVGKMIRLLNLTAPQKNQKENLSKQRKAATRDLLSKTQRKSCCNQR